jgi:hypothetical protein
MNDPLVATETALARVRLQGYRLDGSDLTTAIARHHWNMKLCEALYPALHLFEVTLRNALHRELSARRKNETWFDEHWLRPRESSRVQEAAEKLRRRGKPVEPGRVVAELMLGFWVSLFDRAYEQHERWLWPGALKPVFPRLRNSERGLRDLSVRLNGVLRLRNRVFHHERILHRDELTESVKNLRRLLYGVSPEAAALLRDVDRFDAVWVAGIQPLPDLNGDATP